jgi:hypothetical protein
VLGQGHGGGQPVGPATDDYGGTHTSNPMRCPAQSRNTEKSSV